MQFWFLIQYYVTPGLNKITPPQKKKKKPGGEGRGYMP